MTQTYQSLHTELARLFESENNDGIVFNMTTQSPLVPIPREHLFEHCKNPLTGDYYDGIYLIGEFASIGVLNNNNRIYVKDNYIDLLELLRIQIREIGVYGELEHPKQYATNNNNISHKLVDVWYDENTDKVMGIIVLLDTEKGRIAKEIVKSGGKLALSARAGGKEIKNPDGSITAFLSLLVSFDIVSTPGFSSARQQYMGEISAQNDVILSMYKPSKNQQIYVGQLNENVPDNLNENHKLFEEQQQQISNNQQDSEAEKLQDGDVKQQQKYQDKLQKQVDDTLNQSFDLINDLYVKPKVNGALKQEPYTPDGTIENMYQNTQELIESFDKDFDDFMQGNN